MAEVDRPPRSPGRARVRRARTQGSPSGSHLLNELHGSVLPARREIGKRAHAAGRIRCYRPQQLAQLMGRAGVEPAIGAMGEARDLAECLEHRRVVDARKANRVVFVGRELEGGDAGCRGGGENRRREREGENVNLARARVLVVDDVADTRDLLARRLRRLGVGEIVDAAIRVYRQKFTTMVKAVALVVVPVQVLNVLVRLSSEWTFGRGSYTTGGNQYTARTDSTGIFTFAAIPPGGYLLEWIGPDGRYTTFVDARGRPLHIVKVPQLHPLALGNVAIDPSDP